MNRTNGHSKTNSRPSLQSDDRTVLVLRNPDLDILEKMQIDLRSDISGNKFSRNKEKKDPVEEDKVEENSCALCLKSSPSCATMNLFALTDCNHELCIECILKWIYFSKNTNCPFCRSEVEKIYVFHHDDRKEEMSDHLSRRQAYHFEKFYFDEECYQNVITDLIYLKCPKCDFFDKRKIKPKYEESPLFDEYFNHLITRHQIKMCKLCVANFDFFPSQFETYSNASFRKHMSLGSKVFDSMVYHQSCTLCVPPRPFFDYQKLLKHCAKEHITCYLCDHNTIGYFFADQQALNQHLGAKHFKCSTCLLSGDSFFAFATLADLKAHCEATQHTHDITFLRNLDLIENSEVPTHRTISNEIDILLRNRYKSNVDTTTFNPSTEGYLMNFPTIDGDGSRRTINGPMFRHVYASNRPGNIKESAANYENNFPALEMRTTNGPSTSGSSAASAKSNHSKTAIWTQAKSKTKKSPPRAVMVPVKPKTVAASQAAAANRKSTKKVDNLLTSDMIDYPPLEEFQAVNRDVIRKAMAPSGIRTANPPRISLITEDTESNGPNPVSARPKNAPRNNLCEFPSLGPMTSAINSVDSNWGKKIVATKSVPKVREKPKQVKSEVSWNDVNNFPQLTKSSSSRPTFAAPVKIATPPAPTTDGIFIKGPNYADRCAATLGTIQSVLGEQFTKFKEACQEFKNSSIPAVVYHEQCRQLLGSETFMKLINDIIVTLPVVAKQNELYTFHREWLKKTNGKLPRRSPIVQCKKCTQLVLQEELASHQESHK